MDASFHYLSMINHMTVQKKLMEQLKDTGLTLGQPKGNRRTFHIFMTESGKKNQKLVEEAFKKIEKTALNGISEEEQKQFMDIFCRIYRNLADMK